MDINMNNKLAERWAAESAKNEGEAFEKALTRIKPSNDELEQAYRQGYAAGLKAAVNQKLIDNYCEMKGNIQK
jgi:flagellar biosynthesis/type III secretory pathway protein FliH